MVRMRAGDILGFLGQISILILRRCTSDISCLWRFQKPLVEVFEKARKRYDKPYRSNRILEHACVPILSAPNTLVHATPYLCQYSTVSCKPGHPRILASRALRGSVPLPHAVIPGTVAAAAVWWLYMAGSQMCCILQRKIRGLGANS